MIPPRGFKAELYPLRHRLRYAFGLSCVTGTLNTALATIVMHTTDIDVVADQIVVNPHNTGFVEETGPICQKMSILDRMRISINFNLTENAHEKRETASGVFTGDGIQSLHFLWRPIFFSFPEKLQATDDDTGTSVETILALTSDDTNEDVVPLTTVDLPATGSSELPQPISNINAVQVFGDYNQTTNLNLEEHVWDEDLFQQALRHFTNKGALKACVGRTRHVTLTKNKPYMNFYMDKFLPRAIRRIVDRTYLGIQVHVPLTTEHGQKYHASTLTANVAHLGTKILALYHEWNSDHWQDMSGTPPT